MAKSLKVLIFIAASCIALLALLVIFKKHVFERDTIYYKPLVDPIETLDPARTRSRADYMITRAIFGQLLKLNEYGDVEGALIDKWSVDRSGRLYSFHIRPNTLFHSGRPATLADIFFTLHYLAKKDSLVSRLLSNIYGYESYIEGKTKYLVGLSKTSADTFTIRLSTPSFILLSSLADPKLVVLPDQLNHRSRRDFFRNPDGIGPYRLSEISEDGRKLILSRHDSYFGGRPSIAKFSLKTLPKSEAIKDFLHGDLDDLETFTIGTSEKQLLEPFAQVYSISAYSTALFFLNGQRPLFRDRTVRKYLSASTDIESARERCQASIVSAYGFIPRGTVGWLDSPNSKSGFLNQLVIEKRALERLQLEQRALSVLSYGNEYDPCILNTLITKLREVSGLVVNSNHVTQDEAVRIFKSGQYDLFFENISVRGSEPYTLFTFFYPLSSHNLMKFNDLTISTLSEKILGSASQTLRTSGYKTLDQYISQQQNYVIPLFSDIRNYVFANRVKAKTIPAIIMMNAGFETVRF